MKPSASLTLLGLLLLLPAQLHAQSVATGTEHTAVLKSDGTVWSFGANDRGQLGDSTLDDQRTAVQAQGVTGATAIAAGANFTIALKSDGTVVAWGANDLGQLGDGTGSDSSIPVVTSGLTDIIAISAGTGHGLALKN